MTSWGPALPRHPVLSIVHWLWLHRREGELLLFDSSFLHEAYNRSMEDRYVLLLRVWHPELTAGGRMSLSWQTSTPQAERCCNSEDPHMHFKNGRTNRGGGMLFIFFLHIF